MYGSGVPVSSCSLLIRGNLRRSQAENPLNPLSRFPRPPLIETYCAIRENWKLVWRYLVTHQRLHSKEYYYECRSKSYRSSYAKAAQFIYLNRACWNGLYRVNLAGVFNVPIGTKDTIVFETDNFGTISTALKTAILAHRIHDGSGNGVTEVA